MKINPETKNAIKAKIKEVIKFHCDGTLPHEDIKEWNLVTSAEELLYDLFKAIDES